MIDRIQFFDRARPLLFNGSMSNGQMQGCSALMDEFEKRKLTDKRLLACMLGTAYLECDRTMQPISEYGRGAGRPYGVPAGPWNLIYYGRGLVQLTWYDNYLRLGRAIGVNLAQFPERALELAVAVAVMFEGMLDANTNVGDFTGVSLEDYFKPGVDASHSAWQNSRRVINGMDRADEYAVWSRQFWYCLGGPEYFRLLKRGMRGADVSAIQDKLAHLGYYTMAVDGDYGNGTQRAVIAFQRARGLFVDGEVGDQTRTALYS